MKKKLTDFAPVIRKGPIRDRVHPRDFRELTFSYACEHCAHFCPETQHCTMGMWPEPHRLENQLMSYLASGRLIFCRYLEID